MADTVSFDSLLNTTTGMTAIVNNKKHDDDVVSVTGVNWFTYAGKTASTIYVSGNNFIGFGQNAEQLKIWRRDGAVYYIYRQEGTLTSGKRFLKIRAEGYVYYSSTSSSYALKYEVFLIEGQTLFINVVQRPTSSSYTGTSSITDGKTTTNLTLSVSSAVPVSILVKNAGVSQAVSYEKFVDKYVVQVTISKMPEKTRYYQGELFDTTGLVVTQTYNDDTTEITTDYKLSGFDSSSAGAKVITVTASGKTTRFEISVLEASITAISVTTMPTKTNYHIGKEFDSTGIVVTATASDGNTIDVTKDCTYSGFDSSSPKVNTITVNYNVLTTELNVTIMTPVSISYSRVNGTFYFVGDTSNVSLYYIQATYSDGITEKNIEDGFTVSQVDTSTAGLKIAIVDYFGVTAEIPVTILDSYTVQIGVPNQEDVTATFDLETGQMNIIGTGEFKALALIEDTPNSIINRVKILNIGDGVTKVPNQMFPGTNITNLEQLSFPETLTEIGYANFGGSKLTEISFPRSLSKIGDYCFTNCLNIETLDIPGAIVEIGSGSFSGLSNLREVTFHDGLESIADLAFNRCPLLTQLILPSTLKNMQYSFQGSTLEHLEMGGDGALFKTSGSTYINNISAKNTVIRGGTIENEAFHGNSTIENLTLSGSVKWNGNRQFISCSKLSNVSLENGITRIPAYCFSSCSKITEIAVPASVTSIEESAFSDTSLKNLEIANGVKFIWKLAFSNTQLANVLIPASVIKIDKNAFSTKVTTNIALNKKTNEISGSPWGATGTITWLVRVEKLEITHMPTKVKYLIGEAFDSTGLVVTAYYNNNTSGLVPIGSIDSSFPNILTKRGNNTITFEFDEQSASFDVLAIDIDGIEIETLPRKLKYYSGDSFDSTGLSILVKYTDGTSETKTTGYEISGFDSSSAGEKTVTVTYKAPTVLASTRTASFAVTVVDVSEIEVNTFPEKTEFLSGESFDSTGLSILVKYTDGTSETKTTGFEVSGFDSSSVGEKAITVTYKTHTATFKVTVYDLSGIRITSFPSKIYYKIGETFDPSGLTVASVRQDGTEEEITGYDISGFDSSTAGSKTITVSYNSTVNGVSKFVGSDSFQIKVTNDGKNPFDSNTGSGGTGETEESAPVYVTVHWIDGEFEDLTHENGGIKANTFVLQESICSEQYFIFGGCISNQVTFETGHKQFWGTDEGSYPSGRIEVYLECNKTKIKVFTGRIASAERTSTYSTRKVIAYDYLYDLRNTDIARWYKNQTTDKKKKLTQKQFRDKLFAFIGLEQVSTKLHWDDAYVPDTNNANEMNVVNILKDLCLQNDRFGWMNRDGRFEYLKLRQNSHKTGETTTGKEIYQYYDNAEVHLDTFKSFWAKEGRIWFPHTIFTDPDPNRAFGFTQGEPTAQEAYESNVFYNRNSFFVGNEDWMDYVWNADEYGGISRKKPIINICYGTFVNRDLRKYYRAQAYTVEVIGNPLNTVGQTIELRNTKQMEDGTELEWYVHSYIMSRTLKLGNSQLIDTYSANNAPFNSNSRQLGKDTPEISATVNLTRSEMPTISYAEFTDSSDSEFSPATIDDFTDGSGGSSSTSEQLKKAQLRCVKRIKKADYDALVAAGTDRTDTLYFTFEEG